MYCTAREDNLLEKICFYLEFTALCVQWELVKTHRTDERYMGGLAVHNVPAGIDPQTSQLREHVYHLGIMCFPF